MINKLISVAILFTTTVAHSQYKDFEMPFGNPLVLSTIKFQSNTEIRKRPISVAIIQVGAFKNQERAEKEWGKLSKRFPAIATLNKVIVPYYGGIRLRAEASTVSDAKNICRNIITGGKDCFFVGKEYRTQTEGITKTNFKAVKSLADQVKNTPVKGGFELEFDKDGNVKSATTVDAILNSYKNDGSKVKNTYKNEPAFIVNEKSSTVARGVNIDKIVSIKCDSIQSTKANVTATDCIL